jgi:hypothetical protein
MNTQSHIKELSSAATNDIRDQSGDFEIALIMKTNGDIVIYKRYGGNNIDPDALPPSCVIDPSSHKVSQITTIASPGCTIINGRRYCW